MYKRRKGMKVEIWSADKKKKLGIGIYLDSKTKVSLFGMKMNMPRFKLGRKIIYGYQCWWIPLSEIKKNV
jgi:hypothetical protein